MDTHFASAERSDPAELDRQIKSVSASPVTDALLASISGMLAVLNRHRQVIALNDALLKELGIRDSGEALGLRPGEALRCVHAQDEPGGCGTTKYCSTCGAAIAIVSALGVGGPTERVCALRADRDGTEVEVCLLVRASSFEIEGEELLLLLLEDITVEWNRAALTRTFFHDIKNMVGGLATSSSILASGAEDPELLRIVRESASRLYREISIQECLHGSQDCQLETTLEETTTGRLLAELMDLFTNHPAVVDRQVRAREFTIDQMIKTDSSLVLRILGNMVTNALEATDVGDHIEVWAEAAAGRTDFCVWNSRHIDESAALRVFQRNFSTKGGYGRGFGTYSMKLLGEQCLGGEVSFSSTEVGGTVFRLSISDPE
jgi:signal transduction histidine kinase